jgi:hypothetical protein
MSKGSIIKMATAVFAVVAFAGAVFARNATTEPTHYLFMPTARVNPPGYLVLGLHEISYALPGKLQLQCSLVDNIGRLDLAAKYSFHRNLAGALGLAHSIINFGEHGVHKPARFGAFLAYEFDSRYYDMVLTGHTQIGSAFSIGADLGGKITPTNVWSFLWEVGVSVDLTSETLWLYGIGGIRFRLPGVPGLFFDLGVQAKEFDVEVFQPGAGVFFDVMYCWKP